MPFDSEEDKFEYDLPLERYLSLEIPQKVGLSVKDVMMQPHTLCKTINGRDIIVWQGDITKLKVDAIVNAANESLLGGGGVDKAIHDAAGTNLVRECSTLGGCNPGESKITKGYKLPSKTVIHTVGPILSETDELQPKLLASCYKSALALCEKYKLQSVAFCCISCGFYGYPNAAAADVAISTVTQYLEKTIDSSIKTVIFSVFDEEQLKEYSHKL